MPSDLFGDITHRPSSVRARRRTGAVLAIGGHAIALLGALFFSLSAPSLLPSPRVALAFNEPEIRVQLTDVALPTPARPIARRTDESLLSAAPPRAVPIDAVPLTAPTGISPDNSDGTPPAASRSADLSRIEGASGTGIVGLGVSRVEKPAALAAPAAVRLHSGIQAPEKIVHVDPAYPTLALSTRVQGVVILEAIIDLDGRVGSIQVLRSIPLLDQAAVNAVRQWRYHPALLNGSPLPVIMTITVTFKL